MIHTSYSKLSFRSVPRYSIFDRKTLSSPFIKEPTAQLKNASPASWCRYSCSISASSASSCSKPTKCDAISTTDAYGQHSGTAASYRSAIWASISGRKESWTIWTNGFNGSGCRRWINYRPYNRWVFWRIQQRSCRNPTCRERRRQSIQRRRFKQLGSSKL